MINWGFAEAEQLAPLQCVYTTSVQQARVFVVFVFFIFSSKNVSPTIGFQVTLSFNLVQHVRDLELNLKIQEC